MRLNVQAAPERSDSASEMSDFVSAAFASAAVSEMVSVRHLVVLYRPAEVVYGMVVSVAVSPSSIEPVV